MGDSKRLLALHVDGQLDETERCGVRKRLETEPLFARRMGMYLEDDLLLRDALRSLKLTDGMADRIRSNLVLRRDMQTPAQLSPGMAALLFLAAGIFVAGTVLFQGTARMLGALGLGGGIQTIAHVGGVLAGFALLVWSGRQAVQLHSTLAEGLAELASRPMWRFGIYGVGMSLFLAIGGYALAPGLALHNWDAVGGVGTAPFAVVFGIPLLVGLLVKAGELVAHEPSSDGSTVAVKVGNVIGLLLLVVACTAHSFFLAV